MHRLATVAIVACLPALPGWAEPATSAGASAIETALGRYLPRAEEVLSVVPGGDSYILTLRLGAYFEPATGSGSGMTGTATPLTATLTDLGAGRWQVSWPEQRLELSFLVSDFLSLDMQIEGLHLDGIYDTALMAYAQATGGARRLALNETVTDPAGTKSEIAYRIGQITYQAESVAGAAGVDSRVSFAAGDLVETVRVSGPQGPALDFELTAARYAMDGTLTGTRTAALGGLAAWLVAHPSPAAIEADEAGLKAALRAVLPLFDAMETTGVLGDVVVRTAVGEFRAAKVGAEIDMHGAVSDGMLREALSIEGLELPPGLVPDWAMPLVPRQGTIDFALTGFDLAAPAALALDSLSFATPPPELFDLQMLGAVMPDKRVTLTFRPSSATSPSYVLTFEGAMDMGPTRMPSGKGTIALDGFEAITAALNAAPPEIRSGGLPGLAMVRGLGRADGADKAVWDIEMTPEGKLMVNGNDLTPMLGR